MKLFSVSEGVNVDDYVLPLCFEKYNKEAIEECFWENYSYKDTRPGGWHNSYEFHDTILNIIPDELVPHIITDSLFVLYFHNKRKLQMNTVVHRDGGKEIKFSAAINIPAYNCTETVRTNFWIPSEDNTYTTQYKSRVYNSGELKLALEFAMTNTPVLFNSTQYHSVFTPMPQEEERAIINIRFNPNYSWEEIKELCKSNILIKT